MGGGRLEEGKEERAEGRLDKRKWKVREGGGLKDGTSRLEEGKEEREGYRNGKRLVERRGFEKGKGRLQEEGTCRQKDEKARVD